MTYRRYGMDMERLHMGHIEMVRHWRNQDFVRYSMQFQEFISPESQRSWFKGLDRSKDWYFVTSFEKVPLGLFHIKNIDWSSGTGESGGFVAARNAIGSLNIGLAILGLMDFAFLVLDLRRLMATYHPDMTHIVQLNRQLGYEILEKCDNGFVKAAITKDRFYGNPKLRQAAERLGGKEVELTDSDLFLVKKLKDRDLRARFSGIKP